MAGETYADICWFRDRGVLPRDLLGPTDGTIKPLDHWLGHRRRKSLVHAELYYHNVVTDWRHWLEKDRKFAEYPATWEKGGAVRFPKQAWKEASVAMTGAEAKDYLRPLGRGAGGKAGGDLSDAGWQAPAARFDRAGRARGDGAGTFWSGCGAIRPQTFLDFGGFDETYSRPCIVDIKLGMRLRAAGRRILLDRDLQVEHLKRWRLGKLVRTDVLDRGLPWTRVLLAAAKSGGPKVDDLNVGASQKVAALAAAGVVGVFLIGGYWRPWLWAVPAVALGVTLLLDALTARGATWKILTTLALVTYLGGVAWLAPYAPLAFAAALPLAAAALWINRGFYRLLARLGGVGFSVGGLAPHVVYYLCALTGYALGVGSHLMSPRPPPAAPTN